MLALLTALAVQVGPTVVLPRPMAQQQQSPPVQFGGAKILHVDSGDQGASCLSPALARGARIVAVGTYEGGLPTDVLATDQGHRVKAVSILAARSGPPLVLVLSAYDPVVWDLRRVPNERIRAVFVAGYHIQAVAGAQGRPVRITMSARIRAAGRRITPIRVGPHSTRSTRRSATCWGAESTDSPAAMP